MPRGNQRSSCLSLHGAIRLVKRDAFITSEYGFSRADLAVAVPHGKWHGGDLIASVFTRMDFPAKLAECCEEEALDEVRLKSARLHALHIGTNRRDAVYVHRVLGQCVFVQQLLQLCTVKARVDDLIQSITYLLPVAVANRFDEKITQRTVLEGEFAEHIEDLAMQCLTLLLQLVKEPLEHHALTRLLAHEVPQVTDLRLPDAMDASEALFEAVRVPRQVIVDHEMCTLEVDALAGRVGGDQDADFLILFEQFLDLAPIVAEHAAVDGDDRLLASEQGANFIRQIAQCVSVLREDDEFLTRAVPLEHGGVVLQQLRQFVPFAICTALPYAVRHVFKVL